MLGSTLWELVLPAVDPSTAATHVDLLRRASDGLLAADSAEVVRLRPNGEERTLDVRPALVDLRASLRPADTGDAAHPTLRAVLRNDGPTIRPTDLFSALTERLDAAPDTAPRDLPEPRLHRRVAQGEAVEGGLREALSGEVVPLEQDPSAEAA